MENDPINQRLRAINLRKELAIPENEQVLRVIVYALEKWTRPQELIAAAEQLLAWQPHCSKESSGDLRQKRLRAAIDNLGKADLRESTSDEFPLPMAEYGQTTAAGEAGNTEAEQSAPSPKSS